jgi:hypothetical protein
MSSNSNQDVFIPLLIPMCNQKPILRLGRYKNIEHAIKTIINHLVNDRTIDFEAYYEDIIPEVQFPEAQCFICYDIYCTEMCERCKKLSHLDKMIWNNEVLNGSDVRYSKKYINNFKNYIIKQYDWTQYSQIKSNLEKLIKEYTYETKYVSVYIEIEKQDCSTHTDEYESESESESECESDDNY